MIDIRKTMSIVELARQHIIDTHGFYDIDADSDYEPLVKDLDGLLDELSLENSKQEEQ